jgi:hypothetical protein
MVPVYDDYDSDPWESHEEEEEEPNVQFISFPEPAYEQPSPGSSQCWPLTKFWITLLMFDHLWDFDRLVEGRAQGEAKITGSRPLLREFLVLGFM